MSIKKGAITSILWCVCISLFAQNLQKTNAIPENTEKLQKLSLEDAIYLAIRNNLSLKSSQLEQEGRNWSLYTVWNKFLPNMSLSGTLNGSTLTEADRKNKILQGAGTPTTTPYGTSYTDVLEYEYTSPEWSALLNFNLSWNFNASMIFDAYQTCLDYQSGKLSFEEAKRGLIKNVKQAYYGLLVQQATLEVRQRELATKGERYQQTVTGFQNGLYEKLTMLRAQVNYESAKPAVLEQQNALKNSLNTLRYLLGTDLEENVELTDSLSQKEKVVPNMENTLNLFERNNLTLKNLYLSKKTILNNQNMAISALTPSFALGFSTGPAFTKDAFQNSWFENGTDDWKTTSSNLTLSISLPLSAWIPFSSYQTGIIGAGIAASKMDTDIKNYMESSKLQIQKSIDALKVAIDNIKIAQLNVAVAEESYQLAQEKFRRGTMEILDVQDVEQQLLGVRLQELSSEYNYISNMLELEYLLNTDLNELIKTNKGE